jgi:hypothetical protein
LFQSIERFLDGDMVGSLVIQKIHISSSELKNHVSRPLMSFDDIFIEECMQFLKLLQFRLNFQQKSKINLTNQTNKSSNFEPKTFILPEIRRNKIFSTKMIYPTKSQNSTFFTEEIIGMEL